jgi:hypothetical protein
MFFHADFPELIEQDMGSGSASAPGAPRKKAA